MTNTKTLGLIANDPWLEPFEAAINGRHQNAVNKINELTGNGKTTLSDFANGYLYYGFHKSGNEWVFREWAPNATSITLIGDFNDWKESDEFKLKRLPGTNDWEIRLPLDKASHGQLYKMIVRWNGGEGPFPVRLYRLRSLPRRGRRRRRRGVLYTDI